MTNKLTNTGTKSSKVYQIAIQLAQYQTSQTSNTKKVSNQFNNNKTNRLPKIIDVDQSQHQQTKSKSPFKSIFNNNIQNQSLMKGDQFSGQKSYNIVGSRQVKSFLNKQTKKKNIIQRRNQSALSLSRYSSVKSQNQNPSPYLNKQDVLNFIKLKPKQSQKLTFERRDQQMLTLGTNKLSSLTTHEQLYSLRKSRDVFESYAKTWDKQKMKKLKFPSILDRITNHRAKIQQLQNNTLVQQKLNTKGKVWMETLRTEKNVKNYYNDKYVQKITNPKQTFSLKGNEKLQKEIQWIEQKDKAGYAFTLMEGVNVRFSSTNDNNDDKNLGGKDERLAQSKIINTTFLKQSLCVDRPEEGSKLRETRNNFINTKGILLNSKLEHLQTNYKTPQPVIQFSTPNTAIFSSMRN